MSLELDLAIVSGFGDKGIHELKTELDRNLQPTISRIIESAPWNKALLEPEEVIANVTKEIDAFPGSDLLLVGHSYGALIALVVACRRKLEGILKLVLIDGPLRSDVEVQPAKFAHRIFYKHYRDRVRLAKECEAALEELPVRKIVTIGTDKDRIVPPAAKKLACNEQDIYLTALGSARSYNLFMTGGANIVISVPKMAGHGLTKTKAELYGKIIENML